MTVEALWADICRNFAVLKGVGHFERKFQGKGASPTNDFWHQKSRVPGLSYGEKKLPKSSTAWVGCTNVTDDRQTTDRQTDRQTTDGRPIAYSKRNVIRWRLLKTILMHLKHRSTFLLTGDALPDLATYIQRWPHPPESGSTFSILSSTRSSSVA